jgi:predicted ABC-type sugar transport system permease subunit
VVVGGNGVVNGVLLASAVVPPIVVVLLAWLFLRAGRRHDERERGERRSSTPS